MMTEQITIKLNKRKFKPILDDLRDFFGKEAVDSPSDLAGKCLFFCHQLFLVKDGEQTDFEKMYNKEFISRFLLNHSKY